MNSRFRAKLFFIMIVFALVVTISMAVIDHIRLKEEVINNNQFQIKQIEEMIEYSLHNIEKAYYLFDEETTNKMKSGTQFLLDFYERNPSLDEWDFVKLKEQLGVEIYFINDKNVITHSSFQEDIGLDFKECCSRLSKVLDGRRNSGQFFIDGMDIEQKTGDVKNYSYMATQDKKYLVELGYSLNDGEIFKEYNFLHVVKELEEKYTMINEINVLNNSGYSLGEPVQLSKLSGERRVAFKKALETKQTTEVKDNEGNETVVYRYIHYHSKFDQGFTKDKVIEIAYNGRELETVLRENNNVFLVQMVLVLVVTVINAQLISRWVSKPMYLAFHDSLTGLKNRVAFDELKHENLNSNNGKMALLLIDLDNFKLVNDYLGHDVGDQFLISVASKLKSIVRKEDITIRLGGDEFVIIMPSTNEQEAGEMAQKVIIGIKDVANQFMELRGDVSASIGISFAPDHGSNSEILYKRADLALYTSKEKGKNQFHIFNVMKC